MAHMITSIDELTQNEAVAYFRADICLSDSDNYSLDEKREWRRCLMGRATSHSRSKGLVGTGDGPSQLRY